jgi:hypothetical protein
VSILSIGIGAATPVNVVNLSMSFRLSSSSAFACGVGDSALYCSLKVCHLL